MSNTVCRFSGTASVNVSEAIATHGNLPMTSVMMPPGIYQFEGSGYDCRSAGLYLFMKDAINAPIYGRLVYANDVYGLLSGVSWHHIHGVADEGMTGQTLSNAGMSHKWRLRCGAISDLMLWLLPQLNLSVRKVEAHTTGPTNGIDDGHIMFEVNRGTTQNPDWCMWDITNGCYFTDQQGNHLNLGEIVSAGVQNCIRVPIDNDEKRGSDIIVAPNGNYWCMPSYHDLKTSTEADLMAWYARIFQAWSIL